LIEAIGASLKFLPPYSPNIHPIENSVSKFTAMLPKADERIFDALWHRIGNLVEPSRQKNAPATYLPLDTMLIYRIPR
jgi:hypothetical protein